MCKDIFLGFDGLINCKIILKNGYYYLWFFFCLGIVEYFLNVCRIVIIYLKFKKWKEYVYNNNNNIISMYLFINVRKIKYFIIFVKEMYV